MARPSFELALPALMSNCAKPGRVASASLGYSSNSLSTREMVASNAVRFSMAEQFLPQVQGAPLSGRAVVQGFQCLCPGVIEAGDLVAANFDVRDVQTGGGQYLVEEVSDGRVVWSGCRSMVRVPEGISVDVDGRQNWVTFPDLSAVGWRVVGIVETVYRPSRQQ
jgi:hypothetical protein